MQGRRLRKPRRLNLSAVACADAAEAVVTAKAPPSCCTGIVVASVPARTSAEEAAMIRKLQSGEYRLYSRKINPKTGKRRNLGTFASRAAAEKHERAVQYFKRH